MRVMMVVAMMEMRLHAESIRAMEEVVNIFQLEVLAIFCVECIGILDGADLAWIRASLCGYLPQKIFLRVELNILSVGVFSGKTFLIEGGPPPPPL